jgi:uncharacterized protein YqeY
MSLFNTLKQERNIARSAEHRDTVAINLYSTLVGELTTKEKSGTEITDAVVVATIKKFLVGVEEVLKVAQLPVAIADANKEKKILEAYLPKQLTSEEIRHIFEVNELKTMKDAMAFLKQYFSGQYDGKVASQVFGKISK